MDWKNQDLNLATRRSLYLQYTIDYYTINFNRRSVDENGYCKYIMKDSRKCAIGKDLSDDVCNYLNHFNKTVKNNLIFSKLPMEMQSLGKDFLFNIQLLHDNKENWNGFSLSEHGTFRVNCIKHTFQLK